jgi:hypothetical protein
MESAFSVIMETNTKERICDMIIYCTAEEQRLRIESIDEMADGGSGLGKVVFELSEMWHDLTVFAQIRQKDVTSEEYLDADNSVTIPTWLKPGYCQMTLLGTGTDGSGKVGTTNYVVFHVNANGLLDFYSISDMGESLYQQLVNRVIGVEITSLKKSELTAFEEVIGEKTNMLDRRLDNLLTDYARKEQQFTGDGNNLNFTLSDLTEDKEVLYVTVNGVKQTLKTPDNVGGDYYIDGSGKVLVFSASSVPPEDSDIRICYYSYAGGEIEVKDIRVPVTGFNGNSHYASAGDAVRGQVTALNDKISAESGLRTILSGRVDGIGNEVSDARATYSSLDDRLTAGEQAYEGIIAVLTDSLTRRSNPSTLDYNEFTDFGYYTLGTSELVDNDPSSTEAHPEGTETGQRLLLVCKGANSVGVPSIYQLLINRSTHNIHFRIRTKNEKTGNFVWSNWNDLLGYGLVRREIPAGATSYNAITEFGYYTVAYNTTFSEDVTGTGTDKGARVLFVCRGQISAGSATIYQILINSSTHEMHMRVKSGTGWGSWSLLFNEKETTAKTLKAILQIAYADVPLNASMMLVGYSINLTTGEIVSGDTKYTVIAGPGAADSPSRAAEKEAEGSPYAEFGIDVEDAKKLVMVLEGLRYFTVYYDDAGNMIGSKNWVAYDSANPVSILEPPGAKYVRFIVGQKTGTTQVAPTAAEVISKISIIKVAQDGRSADTAADTAWMLTRTAFLPADSARLLYKGGKSWKYHWNSVEAFEAAGRDPRCWGMIGDIRCYDDGNGNHCFFCFHDASLTNQTTGTGSPYEIAGSGASVEDFRTKLSEVKYNKGVWSIVDTGFTNKPDLDTIPVGAGNPTERGKEAISVGTIAFLEDFLRICRKYGKIAILEPKGDVKSEAARFWGDATTLDETIIDEIMRVVDGYGMRNSVMWLMSGDNNPNRKADTYLADNYPGVYRVWCRYDRISDYKQTTYDAYVTTHTDPALVYFLPLEDRINNEAEFDDFVKKIHKNGQLVITHVSRGNSTLTQACTNDYIIDCMLDGFLIYRDLIL